DRGGAREGGQVRLRGALRHDDPVGLGDVPLHDVAAYGRREIDVGGLHEAHRGEGAPPREEARVSVSSPGVLPMVYGLPAHRRDSVTFGSRPLISVSRGRFRATRGLAVISMAPWTG